MTSNEQMLRQAMSRLLTDRPIYHKGPIRKVDGTLNISAWAREASLGATVPYRFKALIGEFQRHLDRLEATPANNYEDRLARLQSELTAEKERSKRYRQERHTARQQAALFASHVALLDRENEILRTGQPNRIVPFKSPHRSPQEPR